MSTHEAQLAAESVEVVNAGTATFLGEEFKVAVTGGIWAWVQYANAANQGADHADIAALAALYSVVKDCIDPTDWARFERHALATRADADDIWRFINDATAVRNAALALEAARPTQRPSDSSAGPPPTSDSSKAISSSPVASPAAAAAPVTAPDPAEWAEVVSIDSLIGDRQGSVRLTG